MNRKELEKMMAATAMFALAACGSDRGSPPEEQPLASATQPAEASPQTFAIGLQLTPSGAIAQDSTSDTYARGNVVFLSVDVSSASADQKIDVEWSDARGRVIHTERRTVPPTARHAAFSSGGTSVWRPGPYSAVVSINGRKVSELPFALM